MFNKVQNHEERMHFLKGLFRGGLFKTTDTEMVPLEKEKNRKKFKEPECRI